MSFNSKIGSDFLHVPRLPADGKGFMIWKEQLELLVQARGLYGHLDETIARPEDPPMRSVEPMALTAEEVSLVNKYTKNLNQYLQEQAVVFQQITSTILDLLYLKIKGKPTVKEAWDALE